MGIGIGIGTATFQARASRGAFVRPGLPLLLAASLLGGLLLPGCSQAPPTDGPSSNGGDGSETPPDVTGLRLVLDGLDSPVYVLEVPGTGQLAVVEQAGRVLVTEGSGPLRGDLRDAPFLDITDRVGSDGSEQGLLGLAFHPDFLANGIAVVDYTDKAGDSVVSRLRMLPDGSGLDGASEEVLLRQDQPFANHNGGHVVFGPDGHLYIGFGDGGLAGDPNLNGQNKATWLGDILRISVGASGPYTVPADNPYVGSAGGEKPEVWASGLRNPWRFHFDRANGDLWIADVGQDQYEEVNRQPAGEGGLNYGWNLYEGNHHSPGLAPVTAPVPGFVFPVAEYDHSLGCSITGGPVYRGAAVPELVGSALYADYCSGTVWRLDGPGAAPEVLMETGFAVSSFGEDAAGEVYLLDYATGRLYLFG
jgi:glucose/arabinose dehydrogenase